MKHKSREEYLKDLRQKSKELILNIIKVFDDYDGDFTKIWEDVGKSKKSISRLLNGDLIYEMIKNGEIEEETINKIRSKIDENKKKGQIKGGEHFKERFDVEFNEFHRIIGHKGK